MLKYGVSDAGTANARPENEDKCSHKKGQKGRYCWQGEIFTASIFLPAKSGSLQPNALAVAYVFGMVKHPLRHIENDRLCCGVQAKK